MWGFASCSCVAGPWSLLAVPKAIQAGACACVAAGAVRGRAGLERQRSACKVRHVNAAQHSGLVRMEAWSQTQRQPQCEPGECMPSTSSNAVVMLRMGGQIQCMACNGRAESIKSVAGWPAGHARSWQGPRDGRQKGPDAEGAHARRGSRVVLLALGQMAELDTAWMHGHQLTLGFPPWPQAWEIGHRGACALLIEPRALRGVHPLRTQNGGCGACVASPGWCSPAPATAGRQRCACGGSQQGHGLALQVSCVQCAI